MFIHYGAYHQTSSISDTKSENLNVSRLTMQLSQPNALPGIEVESENVVGAAPKSDAPTISEWSTIFSGLLQCHAVSPKRIP